VLKVSDPAEWLRTVGGPGYGIVALVFVAAANLGTAIAGIYASAIGLRQIPGVDRIGWPTLLLLTLAPVALVGLLIPDLFFAHFGSFIALIAVGFAPLCGIQIVDYYVLRRRRIDIRAVYDNSEGARTGTGPGSTRRRWRRWGRPGGLHLPARPIELRIALALPVPDGLAADGAGVGTGLLGGHAPVGGAARSRRLRIALDRTP